MKIIIDYIIKFLLPFLAVVCSYYIFKLSDWITPIGSINDATIKWAFDLAFNTSILSILYEMIKLTLASKIQYVINVCDKNSHNSIVLSASEAEQVTSINCKITLIKEKGIKNTTSGIKINYPKWLTLDLDNIDLIAEKAVINNSDKSFVSINPNYLFNFNTIDNESYDINFKVMPRVISRKEGTIQPIISDKGWKKHWIKSNIKDFKIEILGEGD